MQQKLLTSMQHPSRTVTTILKTYRNKEKKERKMAAGIYSIVLVCMFYLKIRKCVRVKKGVSSATRKNDVITLKRSLLEAIINDDIQILTSLLSTNPEILDLAATYCFENPIIKACKLRSFHVVEEIRIRKPEFACLKDNRDGCSLFHSACIRGDVEMVRVLLGLDFGLCFAQDMFGTFPLHTAVIHGHLDVIKALLSASSESLAVLTSLGQTVFHLAAVYHQSDAFAVLLEEAMPHWKDLLDQVDCVGKTALDIAVTNKLFPIVKLLRSMNCDSADVCLNTPDLHKAESEYDLERGETISPRFVLCSMSCDSADSLSTQEIGPCVHEAESEYDLERGETILPRFESRSMNCDLALSLSTQEIGTNLNEAEFEYNLVREEIGSLRFRNRITGFISLWSLLEKRKVRLIFPAILIALGFSITLVLPYFFPREKYGPNQVVFQFRDVVVGRLPPVFYFMTLITIVFTASTINLTMLLLSIPSGSLLFMCGISIFVLYVLLAYCIMPKFFVTFGSDDISSSRIMWTLSLGLVFFGALIILPVKYFYFLYLGFRWLMITLLVKLRWHVARPNRFDRLR